MPMTFQLPTFLMQLTNPDIKTVLLCGCGGGFDFVHSLVLYPELRELGKTIIIGSYSFGEPQRISGNAPTVFEKNNAIVKQVTARSIPDKHYAPEIHVCSYLDLHYPDTMPHSIYAYYARAFTIPVLTAFYQQLIAEHTIDAIVLFDGGSDSLMRGDEDGLGDPVEDAVSVATVATLDVKLKLLISIGLGADRYNNVSDAATLRAIAELTASGGFRGAVSLEPQHSGLQFYRKCIEHIYHRQTFRSVIAGMIVSSTEGYFGGDTIPPIMEDRLQQGSFFIWALMAMLWAFDVEKVAERSLMVDWIKDCQNPIEAMMQIYIERDKHGKRPIENLPRHEDMRGHGN
jgi:hypothetical protein